MVSGNIYLDVARMEYWLSRFFNGAAVSIFPTGRSPASGVSVPCPRFNLRISIGVLLFT